MDRRVWKGLLARYGQRLVLLREEGEETVCAFFQPLRDREDGSAPSPVGQRPRGKYLYLGSADVAVEEGERLRWNGGCFRFTQVRTVPVGEAFAYCRAVAEEVEP